MSQDHVGERSKAVHDSDNGHSFSQLSVRKELDCPERHSAWALVPSLIRESKEVLFFCVVHWNEVGLRECWREGVVHTELVVRWLLFLLACLLWFLCFAEVQLLIN